LPWVIIALHRVVDGVLPLLAGALLGVTVHYLQLRAAMVRGEVRRAEELRARLARVERDQAVWVVVAATLHEVKNPLHTVGLLVTEAAELPAEAAEVRASLLSRVGEQLQRIRSNVDALRGLSDRARPSLRPVALEDIARDVVTDLAETARAAKATLSVRVAEPGLAAADAGHVRIILENLLGNALESLAGQSSGGHVDVAVEPQADAVAVRVKDDGPGIPQAIRAELFEPLATTKDRGLGLGLPIARALARAMGGELMIQGDSGQAAEFVLSLPRSRA
jgi:two-component system, NtrC family, C4-dicarboxylate transport sensor histidine kinase DctB